jgi:hypothetical protein
MAFPGLTRCPLLQPVRGEESVIDEGGHTFDRGRGCGEVISSERDQATRSVRRRDKHVGVAGSAFGVAHPLHDNFPYRRRYECLLLGQAAPRRQ